MEISAKALTKIINRYQNKRKALIAVLQDIQEKYNWLPPIALKTVAEKLCVPLIDVYSVVTFYRAFSLTPRGKHLCTVCLGTACHVRGAQTVLNHIQDRLGIESGCTTKDNQYTLETVNCLGACALAPIVVIDGKYHGQSSIPKVDSIFSKIKTSKKSSSKSKKKE